MIHHFENHDLVTEHSSQLVDVTGELFAAVERADVTNGMALVYSPHTTCAIVINEHESGFIDDFNQLLAELAPEGDRYYRHDDMEIRTEGLDDDDLHPNGWSHARAGLLSWGPVCTLAAERDPMAHQFYRRLARSTREALLERAAPGAAAAPALDAREGALEGSGEDGELRLADIVAYFLAPGRSGFFLSRSTLARMGRRVSLPLPVGGRYETARGLFEAAGVSGRVEALLDQIRGQIDAWEREYRAIAEACPAWAVWAEAWSARLSRSRSVVADLRANVRDFKPSLPSRGADGRRAGEEA